MSWTRRKIKRLIKGLNNLIKLISKQKCVQTNKIKKMHQERRSSSVQLERCPKDNLRDAYLNYSNNNRPYIHRISEKGLAIKQIRIDFQLLVKRIDQNLVLLSPRSLRAKLSPNNLTKSTSQLYQLNPSLVYSMI